MLNLNSISNFCVCVFSQQGEWCEPITLRPPNEATSSTPVQYWQHHPEKLIFQSCDYEAYVSVLYVINYAFFQTENFI